MGRGDEYLVWTDQKIRNRVKWWGIFFIVGLTIALALFTPQGFDIDSCLIGVAYGLGIALFLLSMHPFKKNPTMGGRRGER